MAFSFVCPTEVLAFENTLEEFTEQNCSVIFVSTDSKFCLHQWQARPKTDGGLGNVNVPLLSDQNHKVSRAYGVFVEDEGIALRGRFIINPEGIVKHASINDVAVGRSVLESLRLVQAYQAEYEHGTFCAANWKPGDATLEPTQESAQAHVNRHFSVVGLQDGATNVAPDNVTSRDSHADGSVDKNSATGLANRQRAGSVPSGTRNFAVEAINKVFGHGEGHHNSLATVQEANSTNAGNPRQYHKKTDSHGSMQNYFDYEPFQTSSKHEKRDSMFLADQRNT